MEPPKHVLEAIRREFPHVRLGWRGEDRLAPDEPMNKGFFVVVDLVPKRMAKASFRERWLSIHGPLYGGDYDPMKRVPLWVSRVDSQEVFSGSVIKKLRRMSTSLKKRLEQRWKEQQKWQQEQVKDMAGHMGERVYRNSMRDWEGGDDRTTPQKFISKEEKAICAGDWEPKQEPMPAFPDNV